MVDVKVQHEDPSIQTSLLLTIPVTVIPETSSSPKQQPQLQLLLIPQPSLLSIKDFLTWRIMSSHVNHSQAIRAAVKSEVPVVAKEYLGTSLDDALHKALQRHTVELVKEHYVPESIHKDEDAMDKGVADKLKKRNPDDDRDEGPPARPDQGLKRKKTGKETKPLKKAKSTRFSKVTTKS
nr:hypothetical protein [Tanacetum cinerariifolium]